MNYWTTLDMRGKDDVKTKKERMLEQAREHLLFALDLLTIDASLDDVFSAVDEINLAGYRAQDFRREREIDMIDADYAEMDANTVS